MATARNIRKDVHQARVDSDRAVRAALEFSYQRVQEKMAICQQKNIAFGGGCLPFEGAAENATNAACHICGQVNHGGSSSPASTSAASAEEVAARIASANDCLARMRDLVTCVGNFLAKSPTPESLEVPAEGHHHGAQHRHQSIENSGQHQYNQQEPVGSLRRISTEQVGFHRIDSLTQPLVEGRRRDIHPTTPVGASSGARPHQQGKRQSIIVIHNGAARRHSSAVVNTISASETPIEQKHNLPQLQKFSPKRQARNTGTNSWEATGSNDAVKGTPPKHNSIVNENSSESHSSGNKQQLSSALLVQSFPVLFEPLSTTSEPVAGGVTISPTHREAPNASTHNASFSASATTVGGGRSAIILSLNSTSNGHDTSQTEHPRMGASASGFQSIPLYGAAGGSGSNAYYGGTHQGHKKPVAGQVGSVSGSHNSRGGAGLTKLSQQRAVPSSAFQTTTSPNNDGLAQFSSVDGCLSPTREQPQNRYEASGGSVERRSSLAAKTEATLGGLRRIQLHQQEQQLQFASASLHSFGFGSVTGFDVNNSVVVGIDDAGFQTLNGYTMLDEIGKGTSGVVTLVSDSLTSQMFAVKQIARSRCKGTSNFKREVAIMKKLRHPNLARLHEVIDDGEGEFVYLVMDFVKGARPIVDVPFTAQLVASPKAVSSSKENKVRRQFAQLANAIRYLHKHRIAHLDIKPDNILLDDHDVPVIIDFGVSREQVESINQNLSFSKEHPPPNFSFSNANIHVALPASFQEKREDSDLGSTRNSHQSGNDIATPKHAPQSAFGTPSFFSPEVCEGTAFEDLDLFAVDVWALGVTLFAMLFDALPFQAHTLLELQTKISGDYLVIPRGASPVTRKLLTSMLCKDPKQRITIFDVCKHPFVSEAFNTHIEEGGSAVSMRDSDGDFLVTVNDSDINEAFSDNKSFATLNLCGAVMEGSVNPAAASPTLPKPRRATLVVESSNDGSPTISNATKVFTSETQE